MLLKEILKFNSSIKYFIIGEGSARSQIEQTIAQNALNNNVEMVGWLAYEKINEYYNNSKFFLLYHKGKVFLDQCLRP